ncbi:helix-turn-helix domain-containing protein [Mesoflavibacter sp. SCSIO 43206]|uniref:helix-turn-helix domain-containing protein n=1 Tax=Mesoflavibacter sp. SCSIO 43206 TaxID=2779362 RepID=UPI001CAA0F9C|nr:helix-turn-helix domain-containing protein [Mesoflavibacter sp. SCSIO 43206]UAB75353.1 helix-turn-helix domain-containing protein [Mesoflavibacter sp. SCSIO 43206]
MIDNKSIAVLPFVNMSNDIDNDYFCDGITEEIINALTKIKGLKVIARTSSFAFKNKSIDVRHIGSQLSVATILEGSIRIFKDRIRINTQLIRTNDGFQIWSQNFDRKLDHIFELQDEISLIIAEQIRENFGHLHIHNHISIIGTKDIYAYKLYLKGRAYQLNWVLEDYLKAIDYYKKSIAVDTNFYDAYFALSRSYGILSSWGFIDKTEGERLAKYYLSKGLKINSSSYLAYFSQSSLSFWNQWNYTKGINLLKETLHKNPNYAIAYEGIAEIYMATNQLEKALLNINKAIEISPLSPNHHFTKGNIYFLKKMYNESIIHLNECLKIDPNFSLAIETKLACYIFLNDTSKFENFIAVMPQLNNPEICKALFSLINKKQLKRPINIATIDIDESFKNIYPWYFYLLIHYGDTEKALDVFEDKMKLKVGQLVNFQLDPFLDPLRENKRFLLITKQIISLESFSENKEVINKDEREISKPFNDSEIKEYKSILENFIKKNKPFLNPNLSLKELGGSIDLHPNKLSWLLNTEFNKNFNDFINYFRLNHFKTIALDPKNSHLTILGLAYDSGFNSKSVFNTYFKKAEGITPRVWMKQNL